MRALAVLLITFTIPILAHLYIAFTEHYESDLRNGCDDHGYIYSYYDKEGFLHYSKTPQVSVTNKFWK